MIRNRLDRPVHFEQKPVLGIWAKTIELPVENKLFLAAAAVGIIDRGLTRKHRIRSEIALLRIGPATIACVPGEIYPELMMGKIENPPGADFQIEPIETPPLYDLLPGQAKLTFGLANDEIGYIIPKSEWDHARHISTVQRILRTAKSTRLDLTQLRSSTEHFKNWYVKHKAPYRQTPLIHDAPVQTAAAA